MTTKHLAPELINHISAATLKYAKFEVTGAAIAPDGESIKFRAKSKDGRVLLEGTITEPQRELELDEGDDAGDGEEHTQ